MDIPMILAFIGLLLSLYAYRVTKHLERAPNYKPVCDISSRVSCKRAFTSKESRLVLLPNSAWGMIYFFLAILFLENYWYSYFFFLVSAGLLVSLYLSYVLYFKQKNFCVVCWSTHLVNAILFIYAIRLNF